MAKAPVTTERPPALDVLVNVSKAAIDFRYADRNPTLADMARVVSTASRLLRFSNFDERIEVENAALLQIAEARQLVN